MDANPHLDIYRYNYAILLVRLGKISGALAEVETLLEASPRNPLYRNLKAALLGKSNRYEEAARLFRALTEDHPDAELAKT